jgi:PAS domain S-box-containing protein
MPDTRVLIVEDQSVIAIDLKARLATLGYTVVATANTGQAAIQQAALTRPHVILVDIILRGEMDGVEAAAYIRERLDIPVIYLTAHSDEQVLQSARVAEPYGYILNPFEDREVVTAIEMTLYKHRMDMQLRESERRFRAILEDVQLLAVTLDRNGCITFANDFLLRLTRWQSEEIIGRNWFDLFVPDREPIRELFYGTIDRGDLPAYWESELITHTGERRIVAWNNTLLRDPQGRVSGLASLGQDVTERRRREREAEVSAALSAVLSTAPTRAAMFPVVVNFTHSTLNPLGVALVLCNASTAVPEVVCAAGIWDNLGSPFPAADLDLAGQIIATGQSYAERDHQRRDQPAADQRLITGVPLAVEHETFGALLMVKSAAQLPTDPRQLLNDQKLLSTIGRMVAIALYRTGVRERLEQRVAERTRELTEANARLTELDQLKSKFIADVSHELRTPAANLKMYLGLLTEGKPEKRDQYMATLKEQAARLTNLIEDILDLSRVEEEERSIAREPIDLNALTRDVVISQQASAENKGLSLQFEPALDLPRVFGHPNRLAQVVTNLVNNAINYTQDGAIQLHTCYDERRSAIGLVVQDTGSGIAAEDLPHIFQRFYRGQRVGQSNLPGTGLGLGIVKEIVAQHGGAIEVESQVGQGSTFRVWLPLNVPAGASLDTPATADISGAVLHG